MIKAINNDIYNHLNDNWYNALDNPIALLRKEHQLIDPWIMDKILMSTAPKKKYKILDVGCGGGFFSNYAAKILMNDSNEIQFEIHGIDISDSSLETAKFHDITKSVNYQKADAYSLPFNQSEFDFCICLDFLEHVESPFRVISEISRTLKQGGQFFFHTFNRNFLSYFFALKGLEYFIKNTDKNLHVYSMFIKPKELKNICIQHNLNTHSIMGIRPQFKIKHFLEILLKGTIHPYFSFQFTKYPIISYIIHGSKN